MLPILHLGLGDIGKATIAALLDQPEHFELVGVIDINPQFAGKNLRELISHKRTPSLAISPNLQHALAHAKKRPVAATLTTASQTRQVQSTLEALIDAKCHVASTCEELAFPALKSKAIAAALDRRAHQKNVAILATGVNPGFAMDAFALACTAPCAKVRHIRIVRTLDAAKRRLQLQKKIGAGMTMAAVRKLVRQDAIGHVGLPESAAMIAAGLGWRLSDLRQKFTPIVADALIRAPHFRIEQGQVRGLHMIADGFVGGKKRIELDLTMAFGAETYDEIRIDADPPLVVRTTTGFPGEASTVSLLVNALRLLPALRPGLRTMLDVLQIRSVGA